MNQTRQATSRPIASRSPLIKSVICLALAAIGMNAQAGEGYKLRQSAVGLFGGEMAASADNPGFFGTVGLTSADIYKIVDGSGNKIVLPGRTVPLPTGTPTGGALPNGTYSVVVPDGTIDFSQKQTQVNLVGGYLTEGTYADGKIAFAVNIPLIKQSRTFITTQGTGVVSPTPPAAMPAPLKGAIAAVAAAVNAQVVAGVAAQAATQNVDTSGIGDTELSMLWVHHVDRLKVVAGASLYVPTGSYDKNRGPNPGFGNFYTLRPGVAVTYSLNKNHTDSAWDAGVTIAGRVSYGFNTTNKDTDYRSGNFLYAEAGITKVTGDWAFGANVLVVQQTTDDSGTGAPADGARYKNYGAGPFISYKIPGMDAGFNLHYTENFGSQNALVARTVQLRFIRAW